MKKFKDFLLSLIIPHRMVRFKDMSIFITLLLILFSFIASVFSNNARMKSYAEDEIKFGDYEAITDNEIGIKDVKVTCERNKETNNYEATFKLPEGSNGVFTEKLKANDLTYEVTMVFEKTVETSDPNESEPKVERVIDFNVSDYIYYNRANRKENTVYMLYVFTKDILYRVYDLGEELSGEEYKETVEIFSITHRVKKEDANIFDSLLGSDTKVENVYYLPKINEDLTSDELVLSTYASEDDPYKYSYNSSNWSETTTSKEEIKVVVDGKEYKIKPMPRLGMIGENEEIKNDVESCLYNGLIYEYLLSYSKGTGFKFELINSSLKSFIISVHETHVLATVDGNKAILMLINLVVFILIPLLFTLFAWLFTRKRGMTKFKSYLNIMSIIEFYLAIIFFIAGWFVNILYSPILLFAGLLMMLWYYIFVIYQITVRIEKDKKDEDSTNTPDEPKQDEPVEAKKVEFKKIDEDYSVIG